MSTAIWPAAALSQTEVHLKPLDNESRVCAYRSGNCIGFVSRVTGVVLPCSFALPHGLILDAYDIHPASGLLVCAVHGLRTELRLYELSLTLTPPASILVNSKLVLVLNGMSDSLCSVFTRLRLC